MAETRTVVIHMDATEQTTTKENTNCKEFFNALGYLSTWNMTFAHCDIYADGKTDLVAVYREAPEGPSKYTIGAVWHDDHYGFHS